MAPEDRQWMARALELARGTVGLASPNPLVGCVIVQNGEVLGEGAHRYELLDHAEIVALKAARAAGRDVTGATAYVTLEPCSHYGRTGPCADALIAARIGRVVVPVLDPNPRVSGQGLERLRAAGVAVEVGVCDEEARAVNDGFARWILTRRPLVTLKAALSADGMLAPAADARIPGETFWITGKEARAEVQRMRHAADAVLTGIGTVLADDPLLTDRSGGERRRPLLRVVLDSRVRTPLASKLVQSATGDVLIVCDEEVGTARTAALEAAGVEIEHVESAEGRLDLGEVLDALGRRGVLNLLLECGSRLNGAFLNAGLVDRAVLFYAPKQVGADGVPFAAHAGGPAELERRLSKVCRGTVGEDTWVRGQLRDVWDSGSRRKPVEGRAAN